MSNNKQSSSIDFFWNQLPEILPFTVDTETAVKLWGAFEQSKAMHKREIKDAFNQGYRDGEHDYGNTTQILRDISLWDDSENYYNETFNNEQTN